MKFFFAAFESAFYWVRANSLESELARSRGLHAEALFRERPSKDVSILVLNRFGFSNYFRLLHKLVVQFKVPYLVDVDDLYWELPKFSVDWAADDLQYRQFVDRLLAGALAITTSTVELKDALTGRFPGKPIFVVENCVPAWVVSGPSVIIANSDAFKMDRENCAWFADLMRELFAAGFAIQLIGGNRSLEEQAPEVYFHSLPSLSYRDYLKCLVQQPLAIGLIPVDRSSYADCKSAIKVMELLAARIPVIASNIAPYHRFKSEYPNLNLQVVENDPAAWREAVAQTVSGVSAELLDEGKAVNQILLETRLRQLVGWEAVAEFINGQNTACTARLHTVFRLVSLYEKLRDAGKCFLRPLRAVGRCFKHQ